MKISGPIFQRYVCLDCQDLVNLTILDSMATVSWSNVKKYDMTEMEDDFLILERQFSLDHSYVPEGSRDLCHC